MARPGRSALIVLLVALGVFACLMAASFGAAQVDREVYRQRVADAIEDGTLAKPAFTPLAPRVRSYRYHYNDCLIASMLVLEPKDGAPRSAVSPLVPLRIPAARPDSSVPPTPFCGNLQAALAEPGHPGEYYHRYVHGDWVLAGILLSVLPFGAATSLLLGALLLVIGTTAALAGRALLSGRGDRRRAAAFLATSLGFLLLGGLGLYGRSFSFAPSDIVLAAFLLHAWLRPPGANPHGQVFPAAWFGAATAAFEFLIGAVPAALVLILAGFAFGPNPGGRALRPAATALAAFAGAFILTFAFKFVLVAALWGWPEVASAGSQLLMRAGVGEGAFPAETASALERIGISAEWAASSRIGLLVVGALKLVYHAAPFEYGSAVLGALVVAVAPLALLLLSAYDSWRGRDAEVRARARFLLAASVLTFGWYVVFVDHTIGHAPFMMRPLSWLAILLCGYLAWRAAARLEQGKAAAS